MLTIFQIQRLSLNERVPYIWDYGKFIESRTKGDFGSNLYWMDNYYAEVVYNNKANCIEDKILKEAFYNN